MVILVGGGISTFALYVSSGSTLMFTMGKYITCFCILLLGYIYFDYDQVRTHFGKRMRQRYAILYTLAAGSFAFSVSLTDMPLTQAWNLTFSGSCIITMIELFVTSTPQFKALPKAASRFAPWIWRLFMTVQPAALGACFAFEEFNELLTVRQTVPTKGFLMGSVIAGLACTSWLIFESQNTMLHHMHEYVQISVHFLFLISVCMPCSVLGGMFDDDLYRLIGVFGRDLMVLIFLMGAILAGGVILAMIEGLNVSIQRVFMPWLEKRQMAAEGTLRIDTLEPPEDPLRPRSKSLWQPSKPLPAGVSASKIIS